MMEGVGGEGGGKGRGDIGVGRQGALHFGTLAGGSAEALEAVGEGAVKVRISLAEEARLIGVESLVGYVIQDPCRAPGVGVSTGGWDGRDGADVRVEGGVHEVLGYYLDGEARAVAEAREREREAGGAAEAETVRVRARIRELVAKQRQEEEKEVRCAVSDVTGAGVGMLAGVPGQAHPPKAPDTHTPAAATVTATTSSCDGPVLISAGHAGVIAVERVGNMGNAGAGTLRRVWVLAAAFCIVLAVSSRDRKACVWEMVRRWLGALCKGRLLAQLPCCVHAMRMPMLQDCVSHTRALSDPSITVAPRVPAAERWKGRLEVVAGVLLLHVCQRISASVLRNARV